MLCRGVKDFWQRPSAVLYVAEGWGTDKGPNVRVLGHCAAAGAREQRSEHVAHAAYVLRQPFCKLVAGKVLLAARRRDSPPAAGGAQPSAFPLLPLHAGAVAVPFHLSDSLLLG